jgi:hypothetical protein
MLGCVVQNKPEVSEEQKKSVPPKSLALSEWLVVTMQTLPVIYVISSE